MMLRVALRLALVVGVLAAVLFGSAGRLDWAAGWRFLTGYGIVLAFYALWGLIVSALNVALFVLRTALEDCTLQRELDGCAKHARRVRSRPIPGVW